MCREKRVLDLLSQDEVEDVMEIGLDGEVGEVGELVERRGSAG